MKPYLPIAAILLAVLNGLLLIPAMSAHTIPIAALALMLAIIVLALSLLIGICGASGLVFGPPVH